MALEIKQTMRLSQTIVMTPQLQQAIRLLQLNRLELANTLREEMITNPILEEENEYTEEEVKEEAQNIEKESIEKEVKGEGEGTEDFDWENYLGSYNTPSTGQVINNKDQEELPSYENILTKGTSLEDHLLWQLSMFNNDEKFEAIAHLIVGNIDENGYLRATVEEIAEKNDFTLQEVEAVLKQIQKFDPVGVGARDLKECLLIQARNLPHNELVIKVIDNHLGNLEKKNYKAIQKDLNISLNEIIDIVKLISEMDPKPGRAYSEHSPQYITPDIYVHKVGNEYVVLLNEDGLPKLRISNYYKNALFKETGQTKEYINEKLKSAMWLIRSIHQRQRTIYKVSNSIIKHQQEFLENGIKYLKPMVLRDIAEDIGMHESTVSRVTANKFIHTQQGIFELKYFFNSSIKRVEGDSVASEMVKNKIKEIITNENPLKPYSDQNIVDILKSQNIDIARRTVAKYREMLKISSSSRRKKLF